MSNDNLKRGTLLHMYFMFINTKSIRGFISILIIVDAKTHKLWLFFTEIKTPPVSTLKHFLTHLQKHGVYVQTVRTD